MAKLPEFATEADLCSEFIAAATKDGRWTAYCETGGWDILLVRKADGFQIGIEAKLKLNAKVIEQALGDDWYDYAETGPDCRAVLVPSGCSGGLESICRRLGITIIRLTPATLAQVRGFRRIPFIPELPEPREHCYRRECWPEWAPVERTKLPEFVPDTAAGCAAPVQLSEWKIKALKLCVLLEERPVTRADFKALQLDPSRWTNFWLVRCDGGYVAGKGMPDFKSQHPVNYEQIKADAARWKAQAKIMIGALI